MRKSWRWSRMPRTKSKQPAPNCSRHTAAAERLHELARQLENSLEKLAQQAEGLAREGERAAALMLNERRKPKD